MNLAEASGKVRPGLQFTVAAIAIVVVFSLVALFRATHAPLWMDEVLAVTAAQQSDVAGVVRAILAGTDFSPPSYHLLVHGLLGAGLPEQLAARLPSILAVAGAGWCVFAIARSRFGSLVALIALAVTIAGPLLDYAVQARPYGLTTFLLAAALALWDRVEQAKARELPALAGIWAALAACVSLHFYGILAVATLGICEALWTLVHRRIRWLAWAALAAVGPVFLAWMPLARHLRTISAGDQAGPGFTAIPPLPASITRLRILPLADRHRPCCSAAF